jgi:hypothetical protein
MKINLSRFLRDFDEDGFLCAKTDAWTAEARRRHWHLVDDAETINRLCHQFLDGRHVDLSDERQLTVIVLFARMLELYQGTLLLSYRGMEAASAISFRGYVEAYLHFDAIRKDPTYLNDYLNQFHVHQRRMARGILASKSDQLADLRDVFDDSLLDRINTAFNAAGSRSVSIEEVARRGDNEGIYRVAYAVLSGVSHSNAYALESHLVVDDETNEIVDFRYGPSENGLLQHVGIAALTMASALSEVIQLHDENPLPELQEIRDRLTAEME